MRKSLILIILVFSITCISINATAQNHSIYDQLVSVNPEWKHQSDADNQLRSTGSNPLEEQQLVQLHLIETEKLLRSRDVSSLSPELQKNRLKNLDVLHQYLMAGVFPMNTQYTGRRPCFIDEKNTYCAVGYLMKQSGAGDMAKDIQHTQNYSYLKDIKHPRLMSWAQQSGLSVDELALIQPSYGECPSTIVELHYNNTGTDVNEYIEIHQGNRFAFAMMTPFKTVLFYNSGGTLYKTLTLSQMQSYISHGGDSVYYYVFPSNENFADEGKVELRGDGMISVNQLISATVYTSSSVQVDDYFPIPASPVVRVFNIGESESTPVGSSLTFRGHCSDWDLQSMAATIGTQNPLTLLPISLSKFYFQLNQSKVTLLWETVSEMNSSKFIIQRSSNGIDFEDIGFVPGAGNSNTVKQYAFTDGRPKFINYYRLKQVDIDGKYSYSKILYIEVDIASPLLVSKNLVNSELRYEVKPAFTGSKVQIYDLTGRCLYNENAASGVQQVSVSHFTAGKYIIRLVAMDGKAYTQQFIKL